MDGGFGVRYQPCGESDVYANSVRFAELAAGGCGHSDSLGYAYLDDGSCLEALQMGRRCSGAVFRLGFDCDGAAAVDHLLEFRPMTRRI